MAVSPRKITKLRKRNRFTNAHLIPKKNVLIKRLNNVHNCKECESISIVFSHFSCIVCLKKKIAEEYKNFPNHSKSNK